MAETKLPTEFLARMQAQLGAAYPAFLESYGEPPARGLRVNTLKAGAEAFRRISPFALAPAETLEEGFVLQGDAAGAGNHPYHRAGLFYLQEPSAMAAIAAAEARPKMRVLDLCAAPGGKSGGIAARLKGEGFLLANEVVPGRAKTLVSTLERLGVVNGAVTSAKPESIAAAFPQYFDLVLVDAPCSGEGMFRKDAEAAAEWSPAHVAACAVRQRAILESAAETVRGGGALLYSTCTFSPEENEGVVESFLGAHPEFSLEHMQRLYPHTAKGEGHFVARLRRAGDGFRPQEPLSLKLCKDAVYRGGMEEIFSRQPEGTAFMLPDGRIAILREPLPQGLRSLWTLTAGLVAGEIKKGRFQPAHSLFLGAHGGVCRNVLDLPGSDPRLMRFLRGEAVACPDGWRGFCPVAADGFILGFGKAVGGTLKNHLPKGLRVA